MNSFEKMVVKPLLAKTRAIKHQKIAAVKKPIKKRQQRRRNRKKKNPKKRRQQQQKKWIRF
jgi:hypothetical protein